MSGRERRIREEINDSPDFQEIRKIIKMILNSFILVIKKLRNLKNTSSLISEKRF